MNPAMNLNLHIERLILNDISLSPRQRRLLQTELEAELGRLLTENGISEFQQVRALSIPPITAAPNSTPTQLGQQIAQTIYQGISQPLANRGISHER